MSVKTPGVVYPEMKQFPDGANSARTAAMATQNADVAKQQALLATANGGSKRRRRRNRKTKVKRGGATNTVPVPQFQTMYPEPGAAGQTVNGNALATTKLGTSSATASSFDVCIGKGPSCTAEVINQQKGGRKTSRRKSYNRKSYSRKTYKKGGLKWGCYSGGKYKRKTKKTRRSRRSRK